MIQSLLGVFFKFWNVVQYILVPPVCYACREFMTERKILCHDCDKKLILIAPKLLKINDSYNLTVHAICKYDEPLKSMIVAKHYSDHIMFDGLADLMWQKTVLSHLAIDCFIPIPLHWTRKLKRGFNQAEILAKRLGQYGDIPVFDVITRVKKTEYQARVARELRKDNVVDAFNIKSGFDFKGKHIMLVDDLCTTGSTAVQVAKILSKQKPATISLVVACRAL